MGVTATKENRSQIEDEAKLVISYPHKATVTLAQRLREEQLKLIGAISKNKRTGRAVRPLRINMDDMTDDEWAVFDHWRVSTGKLNAMLDPKRLALIRRWLATPGITVQRLQRAIVEGLEDVKAQDIQVFNTEHLSPLFERVIIASGTSNRQTKALSASVRDKVREAGFGKPRIEGEDNGEWIIADCGAAVVHIMQPVIRQYYNLEEIWGDKPVRLKFGAPKPETKAPAAKKAATKKPAGKALTPKAAASAAQKAAAKAAAGQAATGKTAAKKTALKVPAKKAPAAKKATSVKKVVVNAPTKTAGKAAAKKSAPAKKPAARKKPA